VEKIDRELRFTSRETEIIEYLAQGNTAKEVGRTLNISPRTVERLKINAMERAQARNATHLVALYLTMKK
jgi:DNA-binding NarL/FixJ family response regulator